VDLAQAPGGQTVEGDFLRASAVSLGADHPTVAAALTPEQAVDANPAYARAAGQRPLLKQLAGMLPARRYALRTEQTYVTWCHRFLLFVGAQDGAGAADLAALGKADVERLLAHLAVDRNVSASTQNQALNALVFLFRHVLERPLDEMAFSRAAAAAAAGGTGQG